MEEKRGEGSPSNASLWEEGTRINWGGRDISRVRAEFGKVLTRFYPPLAFSPDKGPKSKNTAFCGSGWLPPYSWVKRGITRIHGLWNARAHPGVPVRLSQFNFLNPRMPLPDNLNNMLYLLIKIIIVVLSFWYNIFVIQYYIILYKRQILLFRK